MPNLFHIGKKFWFKIDAPLEEQIKSYRGRTVYVKDDHGVGRLVEIKDVLGSLVYQTKLQIETEKDGSFIISALDFFAQMNGEKVSQEEIELFDQTTMEVMGRPMKTTPGGIVH